MSEKSEKRRPDSQGTELVKLFDLVERAAVWHDQDLKGWATIPIGNHFENHRLTAGGFRKWLQLIYFQTYEKNPNSQAVQEAVNTIEGRAIFKGSMCEAYTRIGEKDGAIYLDLCDAEWRAVEVTGAGWRVLKSCDVPIRFRRAKGMMALPVPLRRGSLSALRRFINARSDKDFVLILSWLLGAMRAKGPYPVLELDGEQGSAKSTTQRVLRRIIDPNKADLRSQPRDERDLVIATRNGWVIGLDNMSFCKDWLSDALCRISTGGGFSTRELHTDSDEVIFDGSRPILLNGINEIATRSDLLDRTIRVILPTIDDSKRQVEAVFWKEFEEARPGILGALLDAVSMALRYENSVVLERMPRMADFARWVVAAESVLPWEPGAFMEAYSGNRAEAHELAIEASPVGSAFRRWIGTQGGIWTGHATELLGHLERFALNGEADNRPDGWPKRGNGLSHILRRLAPNLRAVGIDVRFDADNQRTITIRPMPQKTVFSASSDGDGRNPHGQNDENDDSHDCSGGLDPAFADAMGDEADGRLE